MFDNHRYRKSLNRLLKVCYVPATSTVLMSSFLLFLLRPLTVLMKQTKQLVCAVSSLFTWMSMAITEVLSYSGHHYLSLLKLKGVQFLTNLSISLIFLSSYRNIEKISLFSLTFAAYIEGPMTKQKQSGVSTFS